MAALADDLSSTGSSEDQPMPKNPDERIDTLERSLWKYKMLSISMLVLVLVLQRNRIVTWIDKVENWASGVAQVKS